MPSTTMVSFENCDMSPFSNRAMPKPFGDKRAGLNFLREPAFAMIAGRAPMGREKSLRPWIEKVAPCDEATAYEPAPANG